MTTQSIPFYTNAKVPPKRLPNTSRGRALYTTDWFIHGVASAINYDNRQVKIRDIVQAAT